MKAVIFHHSVSNEGGAERLTLEEIQYFGGLGIETTLLTFDFDPNIFNCMYRIRVRNLYPKHKSNVLPVWIFQKILALRKAIAEIRPDFIICVGEEGCAYLFLSTLGFKIPYSTHIHGTIFWEAYDAKNQFLLARFSYIFRRVYSQIRNSVVGHRQSNPQKPPTLSIGKRIIAECVAFLSLAGVRRARNIFVLSRQMAWEVDKLYGKRAIVLKGAFPAEILSYSPRNDIKNNLNVSNKKVILSVCRLAPKKRIDLIIKAYKLIVEKYSNTVLIIGGKGPEIENLKSIAKSLNILDSIIFIGFIKEDLLLDYYACCDVFVSGDHGDFDITPYVALGLKKKVVWSTENEVDTELASSGYIFPAEPEPEDFARAIEDAIKNIEPKDVDLKKYSWEEYFASIYRYSIYGIN